MRASVSCGSRLRAEPPRDRQQQAVADDQAERAVDALELVDVDEDHRRLRAPARPWRARIGDRQAVEKQLAVGQSGQAVVHGVVHQPLLRALVVGDVADEADAAQLAAVAGRHARRLELEPAIGAVGMAHAQLDAHARRRLAP